MGDSSAIIEEFIINGVNDDVKFYVELHEWEKSQEREIKITAINKTVQLDFPFYEKKDFYDFIRKCAELYKKL